MDEIAFEVAGLHIAGKSWGNKQAPPMLALHGWLDNANSFDPIAPYLMEHYHLIALDFPGHGLSSHLPESGQYHFVDGVLLLIQVIQALNYPKIHILGHSLGGCLSSMAAGVIPDQIASLFLIEGLGPFSSPAESAREQLSTYVQSTQDKSAEARPYYTLKEAALARSKRGHVSLEIAEILCDRGVKLQDDVYYWRHDRRLLQHSALRMTEEQILSCLKGITTKTGFIWADNGFEVNKKMMKKRIAAVKNIQVFHLSGGHHIHMEKPDVVAQLVVESTALMS